MGSSGAEIVPSMPRDDSWQTAADSSGGCSGSGNGGDVSGTTMQCVETTGSVDNTGAEVELRWKGGAGAHAAASKPYTSAAGMAPKPMATTYADADSPETSGGGPLAMSLPSGWEGGGAAERVCDGRGSRWLQLGAAEWARAGGGERRDVGGGGRREEGHRGIGEASSCCVPGGGGNGGRPTGADHELRQSTWGGTSRGSSRSMDLDPDADCLSQPADAPCPALCCLSRAWAGPGLLTFTSPKFD